MTNDSTVLEITREIAESVNVTWTDFVRETTHDDVDMVHRSINDAEPTGQCATFVFSINAGRTFRVIVAAVMLLFAVSIANAQTYPPTDPDAAYARCQFTTTPSAYNFSPVCDMDPLYTHFGARETITQASMFRNRARAKTYVNIVNGESEEQRVIVEYAGLVSGTVLVQKRTLTPDQRLSIELNQYVPFDKTESYFSVTVKFEQSGSFSMSWHDMTTFAELHSQEGKTMPRAEVR
jgi:hypothetical protein